MRGAGESAGTGRGKFRREYLSEAVMFHVAQIDNEMACNHVLKIVLILCKGHMCNR